MLIIDEINRGNLAKIFGELYFLLEYRDKSIDLLYSSDDTEPFMLPKNIVILGTMNTADRSIALVDAAMRRRFAFLPLHPSEEPTNEILRNWLADKGHPRRSPTISTSSTPASRMQTSKSGRPTSCGRRSTTLMAVGWNGCGVPRSCRCWKNTTTATAHLMSEPAMAFRPSRPRWRPGAPACGPGPPR